ncbi:hypothetical protein P7C73_g550, partial [Tremellales sp. Uapishka_1]
MNDIWRGSYEDFVKEAEAEVGYDSLIPVQDGGYVRDTGVLTFHAVANVEAKRRSDRARHYLNRTEAENLTARYLCACKDQFDSHPDVYGGKTTEIPRSCGEGVEFDAHIRPALLASYLKSWERSAALQTGSRPGDSYDPYRPIRITEASIRERDTEFRAEVTWWGCLREDRTTSGSKTSTGSVEKRTDEGGNMAKSGLRKATDFGETTADFSVHGQTNRIEQTASSDFKDSILDQQRRDPLSHDTSVAANQWLRLL